MRSNRRSRLISGWPVLVASVHCAALLHCVQLDDGAADGGAADAGAMAKTWGTAEHIHIDGEEPDVAMDPAGNAVAVWNQLEGLWSNRYTPAGGWGTVERIGRLGDSLPGATVAMDANGNAVGIGIEVFILTNVWANRYTPGDGWGRRTLLDDNSGNALGAQVSVNADGSAVSVWSQSDGSRDNIWANRSSPAGEWGAPQLIETDNEGDASEPQVAMDPDGNTVAVWSQFDGMRDNIWANRSSPASGWGTARRIEANNAGGASGPQVATDPDGNAIAVWSQSDGTRANIWANRYSPGDEWSTAEPIETNDTGDALGPQLGMDDNGNAVAVWSQSDGTRASIWANRYSGDEWGTALRIDENDVGDALDPQVAVDPNGSAVAVWQQFDGMRDNIWANHCSAGGGWDTALRIDVNHVGTIGKAQVAMDDNGTAVAVWSVLGLSDHGVWSNRLD